MYKHYGNIGDIWKHLPLCAFLKHEKPLTYIETNSASPIYTLTKDPQKEYGIFTYMNRVTRSKILNNSLYTNMIKNINENGTQVQTYLGSPGLAMIYLRDKVEQYIFFDIEREPLNHIEVFANRKGIGNHVNLIQQDSIIGSYELIPQLKNSAFIHFDPYYAFEKGRDELSYYDVFLEGSKLGIKCMLWYGFFTLKEREKIHSEISCGVEERDIDLQKYKLEGSEIYLKIIEKDTIPVNPGVLGCGILISNLSKKSRDLMRNYAAELVEIYHGTTLFGDFQGDLIQAELNL